MCHTAFFRDIVVPVLFPFLFFQSSLSFSFSAFMWILWLRCKPTLGKTIRGKKRWWVETPRNSSAFLHSLMLTFLGCEGLWLNGHNLQLWPAYPLRWTSSDRSSLFFLTWPYLGGKPIVFRPTVAAPRWFRTPTMGSKCPWRWHWSWQRWWRYFDPMRKRRPFRCFS